MMRWRKLLSWQVWELPAKLAIDAAIVFLSFTAALALRFDGSIPSQSFRWFLAAFPFITGLYLAANLLFRIYRRWWRYAGLHDAASLGQSVGLSTVILLGVDIIFFAERRFPLSVVLIGGGITYMGMGLAKLRPRLRARFLIPWYNSSSGARLLIVGAGRSGQMLAHELLQYREWHHRPVCFVDDDPKKQGMRIHGLPVHGARCDIPDLVAKHSIDVIAIAMPSASGREIRDLVTICQATDAKIAVVSGVPEMIAGRSQRHVLRELTISDLLGRQAVEMDFNRCRRSVAGKVVLVTGAAGSIGQELCRQLLRLGPAKLLAADNNETGLYDLGVALAKAAGDVELGQCILDVTDSANVQKLFESHRPQVVFHAAAYKHVPLMEQHVGEAFRVNVLGTLNVCLAAGQHGVERLTLISSDKAVRPSSVMGATKRIGELMIAEFGQRSATNFCAVRFGNVLGSRGSVVPTFRQQIEAGGPVTVTHEDVSRFFMTIPEAVSLVIEAGSFALSGEIFLLDMGEEVKIVDLAQKMIRMRGLRPGVDVEIVFTGLRPGEKLREELVGEGEQLSATDHAQVRRVVSCMAVDHGTLLERVRELAMDPSSVSRSSLFALLDEERAPIGRATVPSAMAASDQRPTKQRL